MVEINFGDSKFTRVTKGSLGGKFVIPSDIKIVRHKIPTQTLKLSAQKEKRLREHAKGHTRRHMNYMRQLMIMGIPYKEAYQRASQFIGR